MSFIVHFAPHIPLGCLGTKKDSKFEAVLGPNVQSFWPSPALTEEEVRCWRVICRCTCLSGDVRRTRFGFVVDNMVLSLHFKHCCVRGVHR